MKLSRPASVSATIAAILGFASVAVSAYWLVGGDALLDTVGGDIGRWGRERSASVLLVLGAVVVVKATVAVGVLLGTGVVSGPTWTQGRVPRVLCWIAAIVLTVYGGLLSLGGILVETGALSPAADADRHALAWHAWFWDPWFLTWGSAFLISLHLTRARTAEVSNRRPQTEAI